jgi:hypothetical protein
LLKAFERIGILANEEHQRGGLGVGSPVRAEKL